MHLAIVILAAGKGTRMHSTLPKVLHPLASRPMVDYSMETASRLSPEPPVLIVGHGAEQVQQLLGERARYVVQAEQLGTGHALMQAEEALRGRAGVVLVYVADMPLLGVETLRRMVTEHGQHEGPVTMLSVIAEDPRGFGRVVRDESGAVLGIVEEVEATPQQRQIRELNVGVYCFDTAWLWPALKRLQPSPQKGEYYLTDTVGLAVADGYRVAALPIQDRSEALGINTRQHLAEAEAILRRRTNQALMAAGVTLIDPAATYVEPGVTVEADSVLWPGVVLRGRTHVGAGCEVGPHAVLDHVSLGAGSRIGPGVVLSDADLPAGSLIERG